MLTVGLEQGLKPLALLADRMAILWSALTLPFASAFSHFSD